MAGQSTDPWRNWRVWLLIAFMLGCTVLAYTMSIKYD